jgi:hypothetical protein
LARKNSIGRLETWLNRRALSWGSGQYCTDSIGQQAQVPDLGKKQADREIATRTEEAQQKPVDVIEHMRKEADFQTARAVDQKALADSRAPSEANRIAARLYRAFCRDAPLLVHCRSCRTQRENVTKPLPAEVYA